jgi:hypothetical protein
VWSQYTHGIDPPPNVWYQWFWNDGATYDWGNVEFDSFTKTVHISTP